MKDILPYVSDGSLILKLNFVVIVHICRLFDMDTMALTYTWYPYISEARYYFLAAFCPGDVSFMVIDTGGVAGLIEQDMSRVLGLHGILAERSLTYNIFLDISSHIQNFPGHVHMICSLLCFVVVNCPPPMELVGAIAMGLSVRSFVHHTFWFPCISGRMDLPISLKVASLALGQYIAPVPVKQPWERWVN